MRLPWSALARRAAGDLLAQYIGPYSGIACLEKTGLARTLFKADQPLATERFIRAATGFSTQQARVSPEKLTINAHRALLPAVHRPERRRIVDWLPQWRLVMRRGFNRTRSWFVYRRSMRVASPAQLHALSLSAR